MRWFRPLTLLAIPLLAATARAGDPAPTTLRPNPFLAGQLDVYGSDGRRTGIVRPNPFLDDQLDLYDADGRRTGTLRENPFLPGEYELEHQDE
ncbi:MAG: hypothetical protein SF182_21785 [Deltaproteobacteria bacterium]|nr:hypothetical protein [Deltaproteobacteria bacterium]